MHATQGDPAPATAGHGDLSRLFASSGRLYDPCFGSCCRSLRRLNRHSRHSDNVARRHRQLKVLVNPLDSKIHGLPDPAHCLAPFEVLRDALSNCLTYGVAVVSGGSPIDGAAADACGVAGHMGRHISLATGRYEVSRVIGLVRRHRLGVFARQRVEHGQRRGSLAHAIRIRDHRTDDKSGAILHRQMPLAANDGSGVAALSEQPHNAHIHSREFQQPANAGAESTPTAIGCGDWLELTSVSSYA